jgi:hypothetical protein
MRKKVLKLILVIIGLVIPVIIFAKGGVNVSTNKIELSRGETKTFTISAENGAGKISITPSDEDALSIEVEDKDEDETDNNVFLDNNSKTIKVTAKEKKNSDIIVKLEDFATYDEELLDDEYKIEVKVDGASTTSPLMPVGIAVGVVVVGAIVIVLSKKKK